MFDIHCHIIPAIDDGVQSMDEAIELIRSEAGGGTRGFVATPHVYNELDLRNSAQIVERARELRDAVVAAGIDVEIHQGAEVYPGMNVIKAVDDGLPLTAGGHGKHMLVDLPMSRLPNDFGTLLFELRARGITPIIAHPERCGSFQEDPNALKEYLNQGSVCQVNAGSLRGRYGDRAKELALMFLSRHWAHFLASDAHKPKADPQLGTAAAKLAAKLDPEYLRIITDESGRCIAYGTPLPELPPAPPVEDAAEHKGWLSRLFKR